jgi:tripartite-type tricarboxylate transporter receptor subunit TctC
MVRSRCVMEVNPSVPTKSIPEFIAYAKANPGKINMASGGNGSIAHVADWAAASPDGAQPSAFTGA